MWIGQVDFPREVLDAQRDGNLVIFAGAGVSMGATANCPSFWKLACAIGGEPVPDKEGSALDRYLGRLYKKGVEVHKQACKILGESPEPNFLHKELLKLFPSADKVRLVTTNFDPHFSTAAKEVFPGKEVNTFYAPALPLGNDFEGIVYLHGSINQRPDRLVLTDSDFGKAYLTEGWATNFLKTLFSHYTVLFVGYSHEDTVVSYLARGLPPNNSSQRFALVRDKDAETRVQNWAHLGIDIRTYPTGPKPNIHSALGESIQRWASKIAMGILDREQEIRRIVEAPPSIDLEEVSFIERVLEDPIEVQFFVRHAKSLDWLHWINNRDLLKSIFEIGPPLGEIKHPLALWFITKYVLEHPQEVLSIVYQNGQRLNQSTWQSMCSFLGNSLTQSSAQIQLDPQLFAQWIALLLKTPQPLGQEERLSPLLCKCRYPEDNQTALLLFDHLTQPQLSLKQGFSFRGGEPVPSTDLEVTFLANEHWLRQSWQNCFEPNLEFFAYRLIPLLTHRLQQCHQLLISIGKADNIWDPMSFGRSAIEPHDQNRYLLDQVYHLLIDSARQVLEWLAVQHPDQSTALIRSWYTSGTPILRRLAIYGMGIDSQMAADEKLKWLMSHDLLYARGFKHEVFFTLEKAYLKASDSIRSLLIDKVEQGPILLDNQEHDNNISWHYEIYNLLIWLNRIDPECILIKHALAKAQQENSNFQPRPYPDFNSCWLDPEKDFITPPAMSVEQLLELEPRKFLVLWQQQISKSQLENSLWDFQRSSHPVPEAVTHSPGWGIELAIVLSEQKEWALSLWVELILGWQKSILDETQWQQVLDLLIKHEDITEITYQLADLLNNSLERKTGALPSTMENIAQQLALRVWECCDESEASPPGDINDYYVTAINNSAGKITLFWLQLISRKRKRLGQKWTGLPADLAECLNRVCSGSSWSAQLSRIILVGQLLFLFSTDENWTCSKVLPLLSWQEDTLRARQTWHALLYQTHWNDALFPHLLPLYEQTFAHTEDIHNERLRSRFSEVLAYIALSETDETMNPIRQGWLKHFMETVQSQDRSNWAFHIANHLKKLSITAMVEAWNRWIHEYWQQRVRGIPRPLDDDEYTEMLKWIIPLQEVVPVSQILPLVEIENGPQPHMESFWYSTFLEVRPKSEHMEAWSELILYLLKCSTDFWMCSEMAFLIDHLKQEPKTIETLRQICEQLARLKCSNASELRQSLDLPQ